MATVASKNPFALLGEEDASPPVAPAPAAKKAPEPAPAPKKQTSNNNRGPASRGGKYYARGGGAGARSGEGNPNQDGVQDPVDGGKRSEGRGRGRGGRGGRGARGTRFDRHSQTGKTDSDKKIQQGWGGADGNTEFKDEVAADKDASAEASGEAPAGDAAATGEQGDKPARKEREPEPEDNTLTLEQYLAQQKEKEGVDVPQLEARQVDSNWKDVKPLEKTEEDAYFVGKSKSAPKARAQQAAKESVEVNFAPPPRDTGRGRGGRGRGGERGGDRGGDRGGERGGERRGRGSARGGRGARQTGGQTALNVDDTSAFPALA